MQEQKKNHSIACFLNDMKTLIAAAIVLMCALNASAASLIRVRLGRGQDGRERLELNDRPVSREQLEQTMQRVAELDANLAIMVVLDRNVPSSTFLFVMSMLSESGLSYVRVWPVKGEDTGISPGRVSFSIEYPETEDFDLEEVIEPVRDVTIDAQKND